jgi:hypothetical protein
MAAFADGGRFDIRYIGSGIWFGDPKTKSNAAVCYTGKEPCFLSFCSVVDDWGNSNTVATS